MSQNEIIDKLKKGDIRSVARLLTLIENEDDKAETILKEIWKYTGKSYIIGITGPPGAGKSTIVDLPLFLSFLTCFPVSFLFPFISKRSSVI